MNCIDPAYDTNLRKKVDRQHHDVDVFVAMGRNPNMREGRGVVEPSRSFQVPTRSELRRICWRPQLLSRWRVYGRSDDQRCAQGARTRDADSTRSRTGLGALCISKAIFGPVALHIAPSSSALAIDSSHWPAGPPPAGFPARRHCRRRNRRQWRRGWRRVDRQAGFHSVRPRPAVAGGIAAVRYRRDRL